MDKYITEKNNKGFSLFTVIVAIAFVGILGMFVIYIAISNFHMKITDLKGKDSFYTAEQAIEEIRVGLQEEVGDAMSEAYIEVLENYDQSENNQDETQDETRQKNFRKKFYDKLGTGIQEILDNGGLKKKYVDLTVSDDETLEIVEPTLSKLNSQEEIKKNSKIYLKNLKAIYVDPKGRASIIKTDIQLGIPNAKFATPSTLPDIKKMVVVANGGIVCNEDPTKANEIIMKGSIYAGLLDNAAEGISAKENPASIYVKNNTNLSILSGGEYFACGGEINLTPGSAFTSDSGVALWARGLSLKSAEANLLGDTYFSDDLTVGGNGSKVTIAGNYYGYGSEKSAEGAVDLTHVDLTQQNAADLSSAIIINGKNTTVDLSGVQKLMLAGQSYVSISDGIMTGESVTVKGAQLAYLAPTEVLGDELTDTSNFTNPMTYDDYLNSNLNSDIIPVKWDVAVDSWGGKTLRSIGVDSKSPVKKVIYADNASGGAVYFYLNFTDETKAAEFMQQYYAKNPDIKAQMDKYFSFYFNGEDSGIYVKDNDAYLLYVTNGNILSYSGGDEGNGKLYNASNEELTQKYVQKQIEYQKDWFALNRKMTTNYKILQKVVDPDDPTLTHDETDPSSTVFSNWVNERKLKEFLESKNQKIYQYPNNESPSIILYDNESDDKEKTLKITQKEADTARLIICTGNVEIEKNTEFSGIIIAKGKITLNPGVKLESAPLDAAKAFQEQIDDTTANGQGVAVKDFLWDGDQYEFGSSSEIINEGQNTETEAVTYDLADCVTYKNWQKE